MSHYNEKRRLMQPTAGDVCHGIDAMCCCSRTATRSRLRRSARRPPAWRWWRNAFQLDLGDHGNLQAPARACRPCRARLPVLGLAYPRDYAVLPDVIARIETEIAAQHPMPTRIAAMATA